MAGISDYSYLFNSTSSTSTSSGTIDFAEYASIRNGSYRTLLKAYYAQQEETEVAKSDDSQSLTLVKSSADSLKEAAEALKSADLWKKKTITQTDEETGEETETEDYDWEAITKAVNSFVKSYNDMIEKAGDSDTKSVLRNALWMTNMTSTNANLLSQVGISIESDNTLAVDTDALKEADISTLKSLFSGSGSYADQVSQKASRMGNAASTYSSGTYTSNATYSSTLSKLVSGTVDEEA